MTNNAGVELFQRLERVRQGPKSVLATYVAVLGMGFHGPLRLPGVDRYALVQLRRELSISIGVDTDRDWTSGVLRRHAPRAGRDGRAEGAVVALALGRAQPRDPRAPRGPRHPRRRARGEPRMSAFTYEIASVTAAVVRAYPGHAEGIYAIPWYLVVGNPGSGRSTALHALGLTWSEGDAPLVIGLPQQLCTYWMPREAVFIEPEAGVIGPGRLPWR